MREIVPSLFLVVTECKTEAFKLLDDFFKRFLTEITNLDHFVLGAADQIFHRVNACALQAVEATYRQVKFLNGHLKNLFFFLFRSFDHYVEGLCFFRQIHKQVEMLVENLGTERNRFFSCNGSVSQNLKREFIIIGRASDTSIINYVVYFVNGSVDRIGVDKTYGCGNAGTEAVCMQKLVLVLRNIAATVLKGKLDIKMRSLCKSCEVVIRVENNDIGVLLDVSCGYVVGANRIKDGRLLLA